MAVHGRSKKTHLIHFSGSRLSGFTLIELLVVIAVIALLMSVLLPALNRAKEAARSVVCRAHLKPIGVGLEAYNLNSDGWIPGPNTSGLDTARTIPAEPLAQDQPAQNMDWMSPVLGTELGFESNTIMDRHKSILNNKMRCPSNKQKYDYIYPSNASVNDVYFTSYAATLAFHLYSRSRDLPKYYAQDDEFPNGCYELSAGYAPKFNQIGSPGMKIFALEGGRYHKSDPSNERGLVSFNNSNYQEDGGNYMLHGPVFRLGPDPLDLDEDANGNWSTTYVAQLFSYRHNDRINVVFFDGHAETLTPNESLVPKYYFPKGTYITNTAKYSLQVYGGKFGGVTIK